MCDAVRASDGTAAKRLETPATWPLSSAVGRAGSLEESGEWVWVTSATRWNHSGDEFLGNGATLCVWRLSGPETAPVAVFAMKPERRGVSGAASGEVTLVPFACVRGLDGTSRGLEYVSVVVSFEEQYAVMERRAFAFETSDGGRTRLRALEEGTMRVNLGWIPRFVSVRDRALERETRAMPSMATCVTCSQFFLVVWPDGEQPVFVIDRRASASNSSRRYLLDALISRLSSISANPDARTERTVVDAKMYDGDAFVAVVTRDSPIPQKWAPTTPRDEDVDFKLFLVPTGFRGAEVKSMDATKTASETKRPLIDVDGVASSSATRESCAICLDELETNETVRVPCCGACFCEVCLSSYLALNASNGCPVCRNSDAFLSIRAPSYMSTAYSSMEVDAPFAMRQQLKKHRFLEQRVGGEYAPLDEFHLRGDREPLVFGLNGEFVTLAEDGADVWEFRPAVTLTTI